MPIANSETAADDHHMQNQEWMRDLCVRLTMAHVASSHLMFYAVANSFVQRFAVEKEINDLTAAIH